VSSIASQILASFASPLSHSLTGEDVTRYVAGSEDSTEDVTAIVTLDPQSENNDRGPGFIIKGQIGLLDDQAVTKNDGWLIRGTRFETDAIDEPFGSLRVVHVIRRYSTRTTSERSSQYGR